MGDALRFDDKVVIITGAGQGLGRSHAHLFASRGAKVVVNDLGGSAFGDGKSQSAADKVVEEIKASGGQAVANYNSVEDGDKIVKTALDTWGRVDVLINNAGILRDKSFIKMTDEDWDLVYRVHVKGSYKVTHAAWPIMREQGYGRIVMTASAAGIYGNFGQANYSMAKLGLHGLSQTLALEGQKYGVHVNTIAPVAGSRLTETIFPPELVAALKPEYVSPLVAWLCHADCEDTGGLYEVGGGFFAKLRWERTEGKVFRLGREITPERVKDAWDEIGDFSRTTHPHDAMGSFGPVMDNVNAGPSKGGNADIDIDTALGYEFPEITSTYDERDLSLYALGVGAAHDPLGKELSYVYELGEFAPLPTFGVIPAINTILKMAKEGKQAPGLNYGLERILHGEQSTELKRPLPPHAKLTHKSKITDIVDKGKNALITTETKSYDEDGDLLIVNKFTAVVRGAGGWGGEKVATEDKNVAPDRKPDVVIEEKIPENQALLYRLSGDWNPLHADPGMAQAFGFDKPILHGLCTYGYVGRHVVNAFLDGDPRKFKKIECRFAESVFPGETLVTRMWKESDERIIVQAEVKERGVPVLTRAAVELYKEIPKKEPKPKAAKAAAAGGGDATPISRDVFTGIGKYLQQNPGLKDKVKTVYAFKLTSPDSTWTVDLKDDGTVAEGEGKKAGCSLTLSDADFMAMVSGKANPQKLFMDGKLKISGDLMASQKLEFLTKMDPSLVLDAAKARAGAGGGGGGGGGGGEAPTTGGSPSGAVFVAIGAYVKAHPELAEKIKTIYQFQLKDPDSTWTIDLKAGVVGEGETAKPQCTLKLSDSDFMDMVAGKANPQKLFMDGKLKISGDLMASQKLEFLTKIDPKEVESAMQSAPPPSSTPKKASKEPHGPAAHEVFAKLTERIEKNQGLIPEVAAVLHFRILEPDSEWTVDLKTQPGKVAKGAPPAAEASLTLSEEALVKLIRGEETAKSLFQHGDLRIDGDVRLAQRLGFLNQLV